jgi:uncharacterized protein YegJ (DUF2314 family)
LGGVAEPNFSLGKFLVSSSSSPVIRSPGDDPEMEQASAKARNTFRFFWRELAWEYRRIVPALDLAVVKAAFSDPPEMKSRNPDALDVEFMWLADVMFDGREVQGTLINSPNSLRSVKEGDQVSIAGNKIADWMYVIEGKVYGGFTIDLMRSRMSKGERKQHDEAWGFDFGEVGLVNLVPPDYIGEEASTKKGILSFFGSAKPAPQDYDKVAATEHPMSANMRSSFESTLASKPNFLHDTNERGYNFLHQLALAGSLDGVDVCLKHGADANKAAANGMTPMALAKSLGWKKVMARLQQAGAT